ncbi:MAG: hypothetical protein HY549_02910 [Elusimicrobia bacterium]|nr:hypothetical protein [Elusimicrobiota bacterium]
MTALALVALAAPPAWAKSLISCRARSDCAVITSACPGWEVVNKVSAAERNRRNMSQRPHIDCVADAAGPRPEPDCVAGFCLPRIPEGASPLICRAAHWSIQQAFLEHAACRKDADCQILSFNCPFGCHTALNRRAPVARLRTVAELYSSRCAPCQYSCKEPTTVRCEKGRCAMAGESD